MGGLDLAQPASLLRLAAVAMTLALLPLSWWWLKQRAASRQQRLAALTALIVFLTFDLIVFGAFTRLTDSGLGCPDWPGCYGQASPIGAAPHINAAQTALPSGPVTWGKAWIEMIHRYLAMAVGLLILVAAVFSWRQRDRLPHPPWLPWVTLGWVIVQGLFGKYTVTLKLYPAVVTLHLLGAMVLMMLLVLQHESFGQRRWAGGPERATVAGVLGVLLVQIALGGWVSTNYAVLACNGFPTCNGTWWPSMNFGEGFTVMRELGRADHGGLLPFESLVAIHMTHRLFAVAALAGLTWLAHRLWRHSEPDARRCGRWLAALLLLQVATGLSNVVLGWPIVAALLHSGGAAALVTLLTVVWARAGSPGRQRRARRLESLPR